MLTEIRNSRRASGPWTTGNGTQQHPADYEKAIAETGYGLFNVLMLLAAVPVAWTCVLDTTVTTFFMQSSECDFELTLFRRGIAVGIVYIGMIVAGPLWDFVFQDVIISCYGKRNVIIMGLILDSICNILWAHATSYYTFILYKFFNGILIAGPLSVLMPYLSEFHAPSYQPTFAKWSGLLFSISNIVPPALSSLMVLHTSWFNITIFNRFYATWRVYMLIYTIPPVVGILTVCLMPKSPKFLLTKGKNNEALRVFKIMYSMNKLESPSSFKISTLISQQKIRSSIKKMCADRLESSITNLRVALSKPYQKSFLIILLLQFSSMVGFNTMRLWVPQFFVTLNNFYTINRPSYPEEEFITMCEMLFPRIDNIDYASCTYTKAQIESAVYLNSAIIATATVSFSFIFTLMANTRLQKVAAIIFSFFFPGVGTFVANWAIEIPYMLVFLSSIIVTMRIAANIIAAYVVDVTPVAIRPTVNHSMNFVGHIGAALGPIMFSVVLGASCLTAFLELGCLSFVCYILAFFLIKEPPEDKKVTIERF